MVEHLLSFVTDTHGWMVTIHADVAGLDYLIETLQALRSGLLENDCPHTHLFASTDELTSTRIGDQPTEVTSVGHVKIYGWTEEWAVRHGLKPATQS